MAPSPVAASDPHIDVLGATEHNLKGIDVSIPLNRLVCITGVSGSGKSTLVQDVLYAALLKHKGKPTEAPGAHRAVVGHELIGEVVMVDQTPIGRTTRSNPASYVGAFDAIRQIFAKEPLAKERGYTPGTFSFNSGNGRCPTCGGNGFEHVEMQFLSDVYLRCPDCNGRRYRDEVLEITVQGKGAAAGKIDGRRAGDDGVGSRRVLRGPARGAAHSAAARGRRPGVPEARPARAHAVRRRGAALEAGGASGGSGAARLDASRLTSRSSSLFLFDEPTTGLHFDDIAKLLRAFRKLIAAGHSLVVIEHNLDVIRASRLADRSRARGRRGRRRAGVRGNPDGGRGACDLAHRCGAARVRGVVRPACGEPRWGAAAGVYPSPQPSPSPREGEGPGLRLSRKRGLTPRASPSPPARRSGSTTPASTT